VKLWHFCKVRFIVQGPLNSIYIFSGPPGIEGKEPRKNFKALLPSFFATSVGTFFLIFDLRRPHFSS